MSPSVKQERRDPAVSGGSDVTYRPPDEVLACAAFMLRSIIAARKLSESIVEDLQPLVEKLSEFYRAPIPEITIVPAAPGARESAWYSPCQHSISLTSDIKPREMLGTMFHEFNHIGHFKAIIAAVLVDPEVRQMYAETGQPFSPLMVQAVQEQKLEQHPMVVQLGRLFAASHIRVKQAQVAEAKTEDIDEYLDMRRIYRDSLLELTATISKVGANAWLVERLKEEAREGIERYRDGLKTLPSWALLVSAGTRFACWVEERRYARLDKQLRQLAD